MEQRFLNASVIKKNWKKLQGLEEFNFKWESWVKFCNQELALPINTSELLVFGELWTLKLPLKTIRAYSICAVICGMTAKGRSSRSFLLSKHSAGVKAPLSLDAKHTRRGFFGFFVRTKRAWVKIYESLLRKCNYFLPYNLLFYPSGVSLNSIIVYCANQKEMDYWFGLLKDNIEANGGTAITPETYTRMRVSSKMYTKEVKFHIPLQRCMLPHWDRLLGHFIGSHPSCSSACCGKYKSLFLHSSQPSCFIIHWAD